MTNARPDAPPAVRWVASKLEKAGHETWAVGGVVRDVLSGRPGGDWDLATHARPEQVRKIFRRTVPLGIEHGTVGVLSRDGTMFEVTTFRKDIETDGRHAVVAFAERIEDDLARRDFTINAIAWHPLREELLDPFGGRSDLEAGVLRTVGDPAERLAEDYLRILRAFRFAGRFGLEIDPKTWDALSAAVGRLPNLSAERVRDELLKVLGDDRCPSSALGLYASSGAAAVLYPELEKVRVADSEGWTLRLGTVDALPTGRSLLRLAALLRGLVPGEAAQVLSRLKLSNVQTDETGFLAGAGEMPGPDAPEASVRRWVATVGRERVSAVARLDLATTRARGADPAAVVAAWRRVKAVAAGADALSVAELLFDGRDLIGMGLQPGPEFGVILDELLERVLEEPSLNERETLRVLVEQLLTERA